MRECVQIFLRATALACVFASVAHADTIDLSRSYGAQYHIGRHSGSITGGHDGVSEYQSYLDGLSNLALALEADGQQAKIALSCAAGAILLPVNAVAESIPFVAAPAAFMNVGEGNYEELVDGHTKAAALNASVGTPVAFIIKLLGSTVRNVFNSISELDYGPLADYHGLGAASYVNTRAFYRQRFVDDRSMCLQSIRKLRMVDSLLISRRLEKANAIAAEHPATVPAPAPVAAPASQDTFLGLVPISGAQ